MLLKKSIISPILELKRNKRRYLKSANKIFVVNVKKIYIARKTTMIPSVSCDQSKVSKFFSKAKLSPKSIANINVTMYKASG